MNCERDHLEPIAPPEPPWIRFLKRFALVAVPVICAGLVWLYFITRPAPPYKINITYTSPPGAKIHPGDTLSWKLSIEGGKPSNKPPVSFDSLTPSLLPKADLKLESEDGSGRMFKLTAQTSADKVGQAKVVVYAGQRGKSQVTNNLTFEVVTLGPPMVMLQSPQSLLLESNSDSLVLPFVISDEKIDAEKLNFSATVAPTDRVLCNVQVNGSSRTVTLSRNQRESGPVKLAVRLVAPDGRETNQTYDVTVIPLPPPPPMLALPSTQSLVMESARNTLILPFTVSDEKIDAEKLTFSTKVDPADRVACNVQVNGSSRTVTLSRNQRESGLVKLAVRLVTRMAEKQTRPMT